MNYPQPFEPLNPVNTGTQGFTFALFTLTEMRCLRQILRLGSVDPRILISARGVFRHGRLVITDAWCIPGHRFSFAGMEKTLTSYQRQDWSPLMNVSLLIWTITILVTIAFFVFEFFAHVRTPHEPTIRESAWWSAFYIGLALMFGVGIGIVSGWTFSGEYFAGYLTEKALSIDNLFVFLLVMTAFAVPRAYQQKVLLIGIALALVMRGVFIAVGATLIANFSWIFYLFGALLLLLAYRQAFTHSESNPANGRLMRFVRRHLSVTDEYHGDKLSVLKDGRRFVTPLLLVLVAIAFVDLIFAVDSIPAIFGLTDEAYIVFTANAFALMGLRQLYFLIGGLLQRLVYLAQGLAVILAFIGVKLVLHALKLNELSFINGGQPVPWAFDIPIWFSLVFIGTTIAVATVASLVKTRGQRAPVTEPVAAEVSDR
ncbi:tellurite resistance protein TerC [Cryobacterium flavum]|uniref:Tellurite resistance protein TerC n=2 Tax=Cryobacterium flavum TaxID=1424659 RepID=A0A5E9FVM6_9MICO|nr:tellurite resistance protein TerC [Cryobacterium flavum]